MMNFKEIELQDKSAVDAVICASGCFGADYSFANLYIWRHTYKPLVYFGESRLIVTTADRQYYSYPKGDGDVRPYIDMLIEEARSRGEKLVIRGLTDRTLDEFKLECPEYADRFDIVEDRDNADYVYMTDKLRFLAGRKLASKRNHIKHFIANGDWQIKSVGASANGVKDSVAGAKDSAEVAKDSVAGVKDSDGKPIEIASIEEARAFVAEFYKEKEDPGLAEETVAINEMFDSFAELGFIGALLYQKGRPVAFTAGTKLGEAGMDVHFEKALPDVDGAYTMINREYVNMVAQMKPEVEFFNREEDMGIEGLRKAKLSYHPDILMMKYFAVEK